MSPCARELPWHEPLKELLRGRNLRIYELADRIHMSKKTLYDKTCGNSDLRLDEAEDIALALQMSPEEICRCFFPCVAAERGLGA